MSEKKKSNEEETKEGFGHLSRREFLRDAGLVIGGSTMGSIAFASGTEAQQQAKESDSPDPCPEGSTGTNTIELTVNEGKYRYRVESHDACQDSSALST